MFFICPNCNREHECKFSFTSEEGLLDYFILFLNCNCGEPFSVDIEFLSNNKVEMVKRGIPEYFG